MVCSNEPYLEPKEIVEQLVDEAGLDASGKRVLAFDIVHIGETVDAAWEHFVISEHDFLPYNWFLHVRRISAFSNFILEASDKVGNWFC